MTWNSRTQASLLRRALSAPLAIGFVLVVAGLDYAAGPDTVLVGLLAVGPALAAISGRPRGVLLTGGVAIAATLLLARPDHIADEAELVYFLVVGVAVTAISATAAHWRQQLAEDAALLAGIVRSSTDAIIGKTIDGRVTSWNDSAARIYGWTADEAVGRHIHLIVPPDLHDEVDDVNRRVAAGEHVGFYLTRRITRDGRSVDISLSASPIRSADGRIVGIAAVGRDVTDRLKENAAALEVAARKAAILEGALDAVITIDGDGLVLEVNPAASAMLGWSTDEMLGQELATLLVPERSRDAHRAGLATFHRTGDSPVLGARLELTAVRRDGTEIPVEVTITKVDLPGRSVFTGYLRDLSARERATAEARRLEERLRQTDRLDALGQLAGGVAHDFNNQLGVIINYAGLVREEITAGQVRDDVDAIISAAGRAADLTRQLLTFSKGGDVARGSADPAVVIAEVATILRRTLPPTIRIETRLAEGTWAVSCDASRLDQVVMNLAVNARDAMPHGGTLTVGTRNQYLDETVTAERTNLRPGQYVEITVSDSGIGMSVETRSHAFDPFFTTKEPGKGTGLGLATVYGIARQLGGDVSIYSELGTGTSFRVYLPVAADAPPMPRASDADIEGAVAGARVLLVEDEPPLRAAMLRSLERAGAVVQAVGSAEEALRELTSVRPDLLISDVTLPGLTGPELAVRLTELFPGLPILLMSGYAPQSLPPELAERGVPLMVKPFSGAALVARMQKLLQTHPRLDNGGT